MTAITTVIGRAQVSEKMCLENILGKITQLSDLQFLIFVYIENHTCRFKEFPPGPPWATSSKDFRRFFNHLVLLICQCGASLLLILSHDLVEKCWCSISGAALSLSYGLGNTGCLKKHWILSNWAFGDPAARWGEILMIFVANLQMLNSIKLSFFRHPVDTAHHV